MVPELIIAQAGRAPDAVAVVYGGTVVSYGELAARAARAGRVLGFRGAGPGTGGGRGGRPPGREGGWAEGGGVRGWTPRRRRRWRTWPTRRPLRRWPGCPPMCRRGCGGWRARRRT